MSAETLPTKATLQALTEEAVAYRESSPERAAELFVPAIHSAQQIAAQLAIYKLHGEELQVEDRLYEIKDISWKTGLPGKRELHSTAILLRVMGYGCKFALWDPRHPDNLWDLNNTSLRLKGAFKMGLSEEVIFHGIRLAPAMILAQWGKDALPLLERVVQRERDRAEHLQTGTAEAERALQVLAV